MVTIKRNYLNFLLYSFITIIMIIGCSKSQTEIKLENLPLEERKNAENEIIKDSIYSMVCSSFYEEVAKYKSDVKEHQLSEFYLYFPEYPSQYKRLIGISYPIYKKYLFSILELKGLKDINFEFKDFPTPEINALPCQEKINEWLILKKQWSELNKILPSEFYRQESIWDHIADLFIWIERKAIPTIFLFLIVTSITIYSIVLHFALLIRKNKDGFWLLLTTPLSALYWQLHLKSIFAEGVSFWTKIIFTSLILFFIYTSLVFTYEYLKKKLSNEVDYDFEFSNNESNEQFNNNLFKLIINGDIDNLKSFIKSNPINFDIYNKDGLTPLLYLAKNFNLIQSNPLEIALEILKLDLDVNAITKDDLGYSSLHFLASQGEDTIELHNKLASILLSHGADPNIKNNIGWTPLHLIAINGSFHSLALLELLIEYRADPFAVADDGVTNWRILWQHGKEIYDRLEKYERSFLKR